MLLHGLDDHSRSLPYEILGDGLLDRGFEVFTFDRRGSGASEGTPKFANRWEDLRDDLSRFVDLVEDQTSRLPFLLGLSFGGLQALDFGLHKPDSALGVVGLAPALDVSGTPAWLRALLPVIAAVAPRISLSPGLDLGGVARESAVRAAYVGDPLWRDRMTPALGAATIEGWSRLRKRAGLLRTPILLVHGTADRMVPISGTREFFASAGAQDKRLVEIPGAFHALPLEPEGEAIVELAANWMKRRLPRN